MPNWCYNKITFPTKEAYSDFIERYGKGSRKFSYQWIIPEPKTQEECEEKYVLHNDEERKAAHLGNDEETPWFNWYEWHCDKWGCKWDACIYGEDSFDDGQLSIFFDSPWCEPGKVYEKMAELGIDFSYTWAIEGDQASGGGKSENGKLSCYEDEIECEDEDCDLPDDEPPHPFDGLPAGNGNFPKDIPF